MKALYAMNKNAPIPDNRRDRHDSMGRREEEPEWFSSGPISKNDTIELRGFEKIGSRSRNDSEREIVKEEEKRHEDVFEEEESHEEEKENDKDGKDRRIFSCIPDEKYK